MVQASLAALQSPQAPQLTENGPAMGSKAGRGGNKGKKRSRGQENNPQVPFCSCDPIPAVHMHGSGNSGPHA